MNIVYHKEKLQTIIQDFSNITKLDVEVLDENFVPIVWVYHEHSFCRTIQEGTSGRQKCRCSDRRMLLKCRETLKPEVRECHAGLIDIAVPIVKNKKPLGYLLLGRIRNREDFENVCKKLLWLDTEFEALKQSFFRQVYYHDEQIKSIVHLVTAITSLILAEDILIVKQNKLAEEMDAFIDEKLGEKLSVEVLCTQFHLSKNSLYEHFRFAFHCTVTEYITFKRMEKAKRLLVETALPIVEIAEQCGIGSYTYFFKLMKEQEQMTPRQYRQKYAVGKTVPTGK